jgi:5-methylcytosine-specific restriction endonuclease McrA
MADRVRTGPKGRPGVMREAVRELHALGMSRSQMAGRLGVNKSTVVYHLRRLDLPVDERFGRRYDWSEIRQAYESGASARECRSRFGCTRQAWADAVRRSDIRPRPREIPIEELLVIGRKTSRGHLKLRLLKAGLKQNRCERCGIGVWQGEPLNMQLHHINGDGTDNRLANIVFLCPNCHSQTDTYGGRNGHRRAGRSAGRNRTSSTAQRR